MQAVTSVTPLWFFLLCSRKLLSQHLCNGQPERSKGQIAMLKTHLELLGSGFSRFAWIMFFSFWNAYEHWKQNLLDGLSPYPGARLFRFHDSGFWIEIQRNYGYQRLWEGFWRRTGGMWLPPNTLRKFCRHAGLLIQWLFQRLTAK